MAVSRAMCGQLTAGLIARSGHRGGEMTIRTRKRRRDFDHADAVASRAQVIAVIDAISPEELVYAIKRAPSLRGMIAGYIAEEKFERHVADVLGIRQIAKHDDHNRAENKSDRTLTYRGRRYAIQLKSVQTNSIHYCNERGCLVADVQNDASDSRRIRLPGDEGAGVITTCYAVGEYDILAVPLFPFTGDWTYAYKLNKDCRRTKSKKYPEAYRPHLLATTERLVYPLDGDWTTDLFALLTDEVGVAADVVAEDPRAVEEFEQHRTGLEIEE